MGKQYKLYTNATGTNNGATSIKITQRGTIRCIYFDISLLGGAGVSRQTWEVSKQNTSSLTINDTPDTVLASASLDSPNAVHNALAVAVPVNLSVEVGDTIYINTLFSGAVAPSAVTANIYLYT